LDRDILAPSDSARRAVAPFNMQLKS